MPEKIVRIACKNSQESQKIAEQISKQLINNPDFINNKIAINAEFENLCFLLVDDESEHFDITITL